MQYKLHLNLQQRAALRIAISVWEKKEVEDKVTEFVKSCDKYDIHEIKYEWYKLTQAVIKEWEKDVLPQRLEVELIHIVKMTGETIFNWYQNVKNEYGTRENLIDCIDKIHWTPYGTVDAVKIFESSWLNNPNLDITKLYNFACEYAMEEHINDLWNKIPIDIQEQCYNDVYQRFDRHILAYWECCRDADLSELIHHFEDEDVPEFDILYDRSYSTEKNMLRLSVYQGYFIATKYFWKKLTEEEKNDSVLKCARIAVLSFACSERNVRYSKSKGDFKKSQYVEICIFLMNQMTKSQKRAFFNEKIELNNSHFFSTDKLDVKDTILTMLLAVWPWQELFMPVLKDILRYQDDHSRMACKFLDIITYNMVQNDPLKCSAQYSKYRSLLREVWLIVPASIKQKIIQENNKSEFITNIVDVWDTDTLKLILDDPALASVRDQFIDSGLELYNQWVMDEQFDGLDEFINEIFTSDEEKKLFRQKLDPWCVFISSNRFDLADKTLDWQSSTPAERLSVKNNIDHIRICHYLLDEYDYELLEKFLDWKMETEEEKRNCKDHFKSDIYSTRRVCEIWLMYGNNIKMAKYYSSQFLHWFLESEEEIALFKAEIIEKFDVDYLTTQYLVRLNEIGSINKFYSWCNVY